MTGFKGEEPIGGEELGRELVVIGERGIARVMRGPSVIGRTILPEGPRDTNDLMGIARSSIIDILGDSGSRRVPITSDVIDIEAKVIPDNPPKIGN